VVVGHVYPAFGRHDVPDVQARELRVLLVVQLVSSDTQLDDPRAIHQVEKHRVAMLATGEQAAGYEIPERSLLAGTQLVRIVRRVDLAGERSRRQAYVGERIASLHTQELELVMTFAVDPTA
jgi:hypothetical protein